MEMSLRTKFEARFWGLWKKVVMCLFLIFLGLELVEKSLVKSILGNVNS